MHFSTNQRAGLIGVTMLNVVILLENKGVISGMYFSWNQTHFVKVDLCCGKIHDYPNIFRNSFRWKHLLFVKTGVKDRYIFA